MDRKAVLGAMDAIRDCALAMLANATYIQQEMPRVEMSEALRSRTAAVCESMIGTKHDVISELFEMDELLQAETGQAAGSIRQAETGGTSISSRIDRVLRWLGEDISKMHQLVLDLRDESQKNGEYTLALVLVQESAANIVLAFNRAKVATEARS